MQTINILDMRTLLAGNVVSLAICVGVMAIMWRYSRHRFPATGNWLMSYGMQLTGMLLIALRGLLPDLLTIIGSGILVSTGFIQLLFGFERYFGLERSQRRNYILQAVFLLIHAYYTYGEPSLPHRNVNYSLFIFALTMQCAWLLIKRVPPEQRLGTTLVGVIVSLYGLLNLGRIIYYAFVPPVNNLFAVGVFDALLFLVYQVLIIALTFSLVLMVVRRLHAELENEVVQLRQSEQAASTSEARLARAELAAKSGNWEFQIDARKILVSEGAKRIYGFHADHVEFAAVKAMILPDDRSRLAAAMKAMIESGAPYDVEFRIHEGEQGQIKHIRSVASFDPVTRTVFGVITDITDYKAVQNELEQMARIDPLTGLPNRRHFMNLAELEVLRTARYGGELSVLMVDIDHFKAVNDTYGHQTGDRVLQTIAEVFRRALRETDFVGRIGGEEFAVVLPQTGIVQAFEVAERIRRAVEYDEIPLERGLPLTVTVSIGMSSRGDKSANLDTLLSRADKALYEAKEQGRNQVCVFEIGTRSDAD